MCPEICNEEPIEENINNYTILGCSNGYFNS